MATKMTLREAKELWKQLNESERSAVLVPRYWLEKLAGLYDEYPDRHSVGFLFELSAHIDEIRPLIK